MEDSAAAARLEISFDSERRNVDETLERLPGEDLDRFLERCLEQVDGYFRFDWKNWYRLRGEVDSGWLSESAMSSFLRRRLRP